MIRLRLINGVQLTSETTLIESSSANDLNWPGAVGRSQSWPEAGLATKAASRSAIFFGKYSTRFMRRCPFYWSLRSPVPNSINNFSRKHQILNVNSRTTRAACERKLRTRQAGTKRSCKTKVRSPWRLFSAGSGFDLASIGSVLREIECCIEALGQESEQFISRTESQFHARINFFHPTFKLALGR